MVDIGKSCTETDDCTLPNIYCAYPNCVRGRTKKEAEPVIARADTAFLEGVKAGLEAAARECEAGHYGSEDQERAGAFWDAKTAIEALDPTTIKPKEHFDE